MKRVRPQSVRITKERYVLYVREKFDQIQSHTATQLKQMFICNLRFSLLVFKCVDNDVDLQ